MDKMLVVIFDSEIKAYEGSRALTELTDEGSINLYAKAVIVRDASGKVSVKQQGDIGPIGTATGLMVGSLIGLLGGPVGLAVGATAGTFGGMLYDSANLGIGEDFLNDVEQYLQPGKSAVVAEIWEDWMMPVDDKMDTLGGVVFRRSRKEVLDTFIERDVQAVKADLAELEAESKKAVGEAKAKIEAQIDTTKAKLQTLRESIEARMEASKQETQAKIESLQAQAAKADAERKANIEKRIAELKAEQEKRNELLKQAWELTKEAMAV